MSDSTPESTPDDVCVGPLKARVATSRSKRGTKWMWDIRRYEGCKRILKRLRWASTRSEIRDIMLDICARKGWQVMEAVEHACASCSSCHPVTSEPKVADLVALEPTVDKYTCSPVWRNDDVVVPVIPYDNLPDAVYVCNGLRRMGVRVVVRKGDEIIREGLCSMDLDDVVVIHMPLLEC